MKVKKYIAKDMAGAMTKVRTELGSDAVILNSKKVEKGGILGFFSKKNVEVIAAVDPEAAKPKIRPISKKEYVTRGEQLPSDGGIGYIKKEITELKKMMQETSSSFQQQAKTYDYPEILLNAEKQLEEQEVKQELRSIIMSKLLKKWYVSEESASSEEIDQWLKEAIRELLPVHKKQNHKKFFNVFGPTGVGKTTTIAKIAAKAAVQENKKVAFITTDTFRIAAIEQLRTYAEILDIPMEVAYTIEDFKKAKEKFSSYDFILIDSAGRNFRNSLYVKQLREIIDFEEEMENHLVLSVTSKYRDMEKIIQQFSEIPIQSYIFTKFDETGSTGAVLNAVYDHKIPVSYLTTGQNVPDDIVEADEKKIVNFVLRSDASL